VNIERIDARTLDRQILARAAELISAGEVLVCPTDTGYAFSANALDATAVARVFALKGRAFANPIHVAVSSIDEVAKYAYFNQAAEQLASCFLPGALTLVLPKKEIVPDILVGGRDTIGIRIPDNSVILTLANMTGLPLTTTSANVSGQPTPYSVEEVTEESSDNKGVALALDQGAIYPRELSTIVDLTVDPPQLLRQGRIDWEEILNSL